RAASGRASRVRVLGFAVGPSITAIAPRVPVLPLALCGIVTGILSGVPLASVELAGVGSALRSVAGVPLIVTAVGAGILRSLCGFGGTGFLAPIFRRPFVLASIGAAVEALLPTVPLFATVLGVTLLLGAVALAAIFPPIVLAAVGLAVLAPAVLAAVLPGLLGLTAVGGVLASVRGCILLRRDVAQQHLQVVAGVGVSGVEGERPARRERRAGARTPAAPRRGRGWWAPAPVRAAGRRALAVGALGAGRRGDARRAAPRPRGAGLCRVLASRPRRACEPPGVGIFI